MSAALRLIRRMLTPRITLAAFVLFILTSQCSTENDEPFSLTNKATGFCLLRKLSRCLNVRWTTGNRLFATTTKKCLGAQGKSVGSEVSLYDCDDTSELQKWECKNETLLALKGQDFYIEVKSDETIALSRTVGPNNHFTVTGTSSGACTRTHRELYTIEGNAFGKICMFPFLYKDRWYGDCTTYDSSQKRSWCAVETKYEHEQWGYCPTNSNEHWTKNLVTGAYYQLNTQSALTWTQAENSCKQQGASLVSINDPHEQAFISALLGSGKYKLWIGVVLDQDHGWQWSNGKPFRYLRWSTGHPLPNPGYNCALLDTVGQHSWQSSSCVRRMGYICYKDGAPPGPPPQIEQGFCSNPWIPYNGHCFHLQRNPQTWTNAQRECRKEHGDLVSIRNVEDQSFVISQLGYASTDELWIGLNDKNTEGLFDWSDHSPVSFTSWMYGRPAVSTDAEDCVLIRGENGNWADRLCDEKHGFICMKQSESERTGDEVDLDLGCKAGWKRHGSYCYFVGAETKTFDEASDDCKSSGSYLADVSNGVDNAFLVSLVGLRPEKYFWLGLSNQKNIDEFVWTNKDSVRFTHWNAQMPGYRQGCVAMTTGVLAGLWDLLPCTNQEKYICKHQADGAVITSAPPTQSPPQCADGWSRVGIRNVCYKFFTGPRANEKTWFEARDYCRAIGGDLLSIHSSNDLRVARHGKAWIGLHIPESSTGYEWSDGSPLNFQHWQEGEPNNFNDAESCAEFIIYNWDDAGSWNDANCESYNDWLCQIRAGVTPKPPPNATVAEFNTTSDGWLMWRGSQYLINTRSKTMEDARHFCQQRNGDLVSINSKDENSFLWKQISRSYGHYYIGLSVDLDGSFWWMDGSSVGLQRWDENQPNSNAFDENCVTMTYYMGFWRTCNCGQERQFICKRGHPPPANTTVAPTVPPKGGCPVTWTNFDSKCYKINTAQKATWEEARRQCISIGGNLVSVPTRRVQAFLTTKMVDVATTDLWIGLNGINKDGFYWTDGKPRRYTNWGFSKLRRSPGTFYQRWNEEDCVVMNSNPSLGTGKWLVKSCNDTNGFICLRNLDPNIKAQTDVTDPNIYIALGNDSIKAVTQNLTWDDAKRHCESDKASLASLRNEWTQAYIELLAMNLKSPLWIGLNKELTGYFRYIDGWNLKFANWATNEPRSNQPCVFVDMEGKWRTTFCNRTMNSVCMLSTDVPPTQSTNYPGVCPEETNVDYHQSNSWLPFKDRCYLFVVDETEWANAASSCARHGGALASIEDPSEQEFLKNNVEIFKDTYTSFWIGLYKTHKGTWMWLDRTVLDYTNWAEDEPNSDFGAIITLDGTWTTGRRWHDRPYICETPKVKPQDQELKPDAQGQDPRSRVHTSLVVVLIILITSSLIVTAFFLYKKSPRLIPTFDNPLYFGSERSQPDVVDTNKLIEKAEEENPEPIITL
ncbi:macrophage mannose receptor 1-like [Toxotes jaculatrix]|uniref:macrophage mannose receptor 1-like n=1 Tax=Toxotes jaculatrix TaxID=941984 RepID=UPI001B3A97BB|nr:macrophage mannose receptor 1-like [Toxotes jaculatrix]